MLTYILRNLRNIALMLSVCFALTPNHVFGQAGSFSTVSASAPHYNAGVMLLLTDGTVICKNSSGGGEGTGWDRLTPLNGSYLNGTWSSIASMDSSRLYFSSQVLPDGRVYVCGGEYGGGGKNGEVYDPKLNVWYAAGTGTTTGTYFLPHSVLDANSEILPNGDVLQACVGCGGTTTYLWNPKTNTYSNGPSSLRYDDEAVWVKLPDSSILFMDDFGPTSERYIPSTNTWVYDATAPENLYDPYGGEEGPAFLLPNGKVFFIGSLPNTLYYTPSGTPSPGTWTEGPSLPDTSGAPDAAAAMLPNGHILLVLSHTPTSTNSYPSPTKYYEFDYTTNTFTLLTPPWGTGDSTDNPTFISNMLDLPDGTVLFTNQGSDRYYVYTPGSGPLAAGQPTINNVNTISCDSFQITGTLFNGICEGAAYGDDWQMSTNYPIVRLTSGSNVYYATTYNWNRVGAVMTGSAPDTAFFKLPAGLPAGSYSLQVIANGNPSANYAFNTTPSPISPATASVCSGNSTALTDTSSGGSWSSGNTSIATVASGIVTGTGAGTVLISYTLNGECSATEVVSVNIAPPAITGIEYTSVGDSTMLSDGTYGGAWSSTNTGIATVDSATGAVTGVAAGTTTISYINSCGSTAATYTVVAGALCIPAPTDAGTSCSEFGLTFQSVNLAGVEGTAINDETACTGTGYIDLTSSKSCSLDKGDTYTINITAGYNSAYMQFWIDFNGDNVFESSESVGGNATAFSGPGAVSITIPSTVSPGTYRMRGVLSFSGSGHHYPTMNPCMSGYTYGEARDYEVTILCNTTAITGTAVVCPGATTALTDVTSGGTWGSGNISVATVGSTGVITGVASGASVVSYSVDGCSSSVVVTVSALPVAGTISGSTAVCVGASITMTDASGGGVWSSTNTAVGSVSGSVMSGVTAGSTTISYTVTNSCGTVAATQNVTVNPLPDAGTITGTSAVCIAATTNLTDGVLGGIWSSGSGNAIVSSTGVVTGQATGTANISYTVSNGCGSSSAISVVTVSVTSAGTINGASIVTVGTGITLTDTTAGGVWSPGNSNATVSGGLVTGVAAGTVTISYAVTGSCGTGYATKVITVNNSSVSGITGSSSLCEGGTTTLTNATTGGTWSMESLIATINGSTGVVTASNAYTGTATVTYTAGGSYTTMILTVNANPTPIQVATLECVGTSTTFSDATAGGVWSGTGDATISGTGTSGTFVSGAVAGTATITYTLPTGCYVTLTKAVYANPQPITGTFNVCVGGVTNLSDASPVSNWFSSNTAVATISGSNVTGVSSGTATITFQTSAIGYCLATQVVTVSAQPASIAGNSGALCPGSTLALTDGAGTWTSSSTAIATIASTGVVTGVAGGTAVVTYLEAGTAGCTAQTVVTVNTVAPITGARTMCLGGTTMLADATTGGTWLSGSTGIATVNSGQVTGTGIGTAMITYTTAGGCEQAITVTVSGVSAAISGSLFVCNGTTTTLSDASVGGTWSMSSLIATVGSASGVVTASASYTGTAIISYTASGCSATAVLTVNAKPAPIQGATAECAGATVSLTDAIAGGTWSGSGGATVSGTGATGTLIAGADGGTATVTYTIGTGCAITINNTIYAAPQPIMGKFSMCIGLVTLLSDASPVSSWSSSNTAIAIASGADISGEGAGTATITFKTSSAGNCITTQVVTVSAMPVVAAISGPATISNAGSPVSISDVTAGGVWTSSNTSVITLAGSTSNPMGATALTTTGSSVITYAVTISGCTTKVTKTFSAAAASHPDGGNALVIAGSAVSLANDVPGGVWSSSDNGIATVDGGGLVTGLMPGNVIITHDMTGDDGVVATNVTNVTVSAAPAMITILPNPNKGTFAVKGTLGSMANEPVTLEVTDFLGQVIYKAQAAAQGGKLNETITLSNSLANGMYILNVQSGTVHSTSHFVIAQ